MGEEETLRIDEEIVDLAEGSEALFIPTASEDSEEYIEDFREIYGEKLGCETEILMLTEYPSRENIKEKIEAADLIYVGGGNTRKMMEIWKERGVDKMLREAREDTVLSGLSAGAICWFQYGHSDSESYETEGEWDFIRVEGLNLVEDIIFCPHYHSENREESFQEMMRKNPDKTSLAVDDKAAVKIEDGELEVMKSEESVKAYRIENGEKERLETGKEYSLKN